MKKIHQLARKFKKRAAEQEELGFDEELDFEPDSKRQDPFENSIDSDMESEFDPGRAWKEAPDDEVFRQESFTKAMKEITHLAANISKIYNTDSAEEYSKREISMIASVLNGLKKAVLVGQIGSFGEHMGSENSVVVALNKTLEELYSNE